ncbi:hypothetical protein BH24CHL7_BH24CHL7_03620 [soil metagenome]
MASPILLLSVAGTAADRLERLLHARGYEVTSETDIAAAVRAAPAHRLVIVEAADSSRAVALTRRVQKQLGDQLPILAVAHGHDIDDRVALLEAGADDVLGQPFDERELEALVEALLLRTAPGLAVPGAGEIAAAGLRSGRGRVFAIAATKGGSGSTALAVNLALALGERPEADVAIADLDLYHGQVAVHLDVRGDVHTAQLARHSQDDMAELLTSAGADHASGLTVFAAPHRPDEGANVTAADARRLVGALRSQHSYVVVDAGTVMDARALALLQLSEKVVLTVTPEIPALRTLHGLLEVIADSGTLSDRIVFVLNQLFARPMLSAEQIEENLGVKFALQIPYSDRLFLQAVNEGQPLLTAAPRSPQAAQIRRLAGLLLGEEQQEAGEAEPRRRRGAFRRRG